MAQIFVVTHNGLPPTQGGKRIGYYFKGTQMHYLQYLSGHIQHFPLPKRRRPPKPKPKIIVYYDLPRIDSWGDCSGCRSSNTIYVWENTDAGEMRLTKCNNCGRLMR